MASTVAKLPADASLGGAVELRPIPINVQGDAIADIPCAFTVDVEDWYQSCVDLDAPITERVVRNVDQILTVLDVAGIKGSFFVQGLVAEAFPLMIETLVAEGHEIQSHGYSHRPLHALNRRQLRQELEYAKKSVEDVCGTAVTAFRAPDFSILQSNLWALEVLAETGFVVDSSIFPMWTSRFGIHAWEVGPHRVVMPSGSTLIEVPVAIASLAGQQLPVAGGRYWRLLPRPVIEHGIREIRALRRPVILYFHPYEFAARELGDYRGDVSRWRRTSQSLGRKALVRRLTRLLREFPFGRFDATLSAWGIG
jgi:polysaccharide deacetylase family protein (PEP-CTERM system associated)